MRKCKGKYYKDGKCEEFAFGYFHKWGIGYEHSVIGDIKVDTAIVELMNGEIITPYASDIKFIDECNEEKMMKWDIRLQYLDFILMMEKKLK